MALGPLVGDMALQPAPADVLRAINQLLVTQHAVSRGQLLALGLSSDALQGRLESGALIRLHRGVYAMGGSPPTRERRWAAAVLACGPTAALSHLSAAALWCVRHTDPVVIDVSLASRSRRGRKGIRTHRPRHLTADDVGAHRGVRTTAVPRTLIDCAEVLQPRKIERMLDEAHHLKLLDTAELDRSLERHRHRTGAARLRKLLTTHEPGTTRTRSPLEESFLQLIRQTGLPQPLVNEELGPYTIDFLWPQERVAVETDGRDSHERAAARERDYRRDAWLNANDYRPLRFTWLQVKHRPDEVLAALGAALPDRR